MRLSEKSCVPCRGGIPPLSPEQAQRFLEHAPGWCLTHDSTRLERRFNFKNFGTALDFVNRIGALAEQEGHHPDICFGWGYVSVVYYTHKIGGLHENDFVMAAKTSESYEKGNDG
jgi:4a-hydroxytetrahydrobiopterin dehydratase